METVPHTYWSRVGWVVLGIAVGVLVIMFLRVLYYEFMQLRPNMAPGIGLLLSPVLIVAMTPTAVFFEAALSRFWFVVPGRMNNILVGISYASIFIALLGPGFGAVFVITNPLVVRWILNRRTQNATTT
jgi:hypothetical protein